MVYTVLQAQRFSKPPIGDLQWLPDMINIGCQKKGTLCAKLHEHLKESKWLPNHRN